MQVMSFWQIDVHLCYSVTGSSANVTNKGRKNSVAGTGMQIGRCANISPCSCGFVSVCVCWTQNFGKAFLRPDANKNNENFLLK